MKMENLNAEQIKYCLELILKSGIGMSRDDVDVTDIKRALALINSQEQKIKELNRAGICRDILNFENRKEVRECACGARFSAFVADKKDVMCAKCKHERGETANEN